MKTILFTSVIMFAFLSSTAIAGETIKDTTIAVSGNCVQCKTRIEKAVAIKEVKYAKWDKGSKLLRIAFNQNQISLDSLQQRIAAVGHDTGKYTADDTVYKNLPSCCHYRDGAAHH